MKRYLRRVLAGTALVIILVMLGGSLAAFAGVSVSAAREELTALLNAAQAFYTQYDVDAVDGATAGTSDANDPTGATGATDATDATSATDPTGATDTANATNTTDATDAASATNTTDATDSAGAADGTDATGATDPTGATGATSASDTKSGAADDAAKTDGVSVQDEAQYARELTAARCIAHTGVRATLIAVDGRVIYDSDATGDMDDHSGRTEFIEALDGGDGFAQRTSESMGSSMIYCARRLGGAVLRLSTQSASAYDVLWEMLPLLIALALLLGAGAVAFAGRFAGRFTQAIQALDDMLESGHPLSVDTFEELQPVLQGVACRIEKLQTDMQEVRRTERMRTDFVANASHELKSPLTSIKGFAELMSVGCVPDPAKQKEYLNRIASESDRMLGVIDDILYLSRLEGDSHAAEEPVELLPLALEVKKSLEPLAAARGISIDVTGSGRLMGAPREIWTLIYNLVDNAIRYGVDGGWVKVAVADGLIEVSDNGIGMDAQAQSRVFERFYRVDPSRSRKSGGTGLGLSIVKHIVLNNGGQVTLKSEPGVGSTFTCHMKPVIGARH
ncbi:MAG TPA: hypothetical protein IAC59_03370 [Candidatus Fimadaptatus faecigallinarum]|uniref:histidine kinase n=1 Tax=Candidatus Fimadaptatus faecigallinarum TaxID=2840814 RepID=A0A9D1S4I3_9FIRM|nr:hypothetical protein [Candidatus Fimadaptatus faecigallinarum]